MSPPSGGDAATWRNVALLLIPICPVFAPPGLFGIIGIIYNICHFVGMCKKNRQTNDEVTFKKRLEVSLTRPGSH